MFLNYLKNFFTQKIVKKNLSNVKHIPTQTTIQTIGIIFDESYSAALRQELFYAKDKIKKNEVFDYPVFSHKDLSWTATFDKSEVKDFTAQKFDLLINYYDTEKSALLLASNQSKAIFKVGFASIDKKLNHFMIDTNAENYKVFIEELFKYLKILNKI